MGWRYYAEYVDGSGVGKGWLHRDLPLTAPELTEVLSGPSILQARIDTVYHDLFDGQPKLRKDRIAIYAEADGQLWGGWLLDEVVPDGPTITLTGYGFCGYPAGMPFDAEYSRVQVDPMVVVRDIWGWVQSQPGSNLGLQLDWGTSPARIGTPAVTRYPDPVDAKTLSDEDANAKLAAGWFGNWGETIAAGEIADRLEDRQSDFENETPDDDDEHPINDDWTWPGSEPFGHVMYWHNHLVALASSQGIPAGASAPENLQVQIDWLRAHEENAPERLEPPRGGDPITTVGMPTEEYDRLRSIGWSTPLEQPWAEAATLIRDRYATFELIFEDWTWWDAPTVVNEWNDFLRSLPGQPGYLDRPATINWLNQYLADLGDQTLLYPPSPIREEVTAAQPYELMWWQTFDLGGEIDTLAQSTPFEYREEHYWADADRTVVGHRLVGRHPRLGRRRDDLRFVLGENVDVLPSATIGTDEDANDIIVLGAGEGRAMIRGRATVQNGALRRPVVVEDKTIRSVGAANSRAARELASRATVPGVARLLVRDTPDTPIGSWRVGDEIRVQTEMDWLDTDVWARVVATKIRPGDSDVAEITLVRP